MSDDIDFNAADAASFDQDFSDSLGQGGSANPASASAPATAVPQSGAPASPPASPAGASLPGTPSSLPDPYAAPPKSWHSDYHSFYGTADPKLREYIHKREEQALAGIRKYAKEAEFGTKLREKMQPFEPLFQQYGVDPVQAFDSLLRVHVGLTHGDATQRKEWAKYLAENYGLQELLGPGQQNDETISELRKQLGRLESTLYADKRSKIEAEVQAFASDPKNEYFNELYDDICAAIQKGSAANIAEAYELAQWQNPGVRAKLIAKMAGQEAAKPQATPAPPPLRSSPEPVAPRPKIGDIDDTLEEAYKAATSR